MKRMSSVVHKALDEHGSTHTNFHQFIDDCGLNIIFTFQHNHDLYILIRIGFVACLVLRVYLYHKEEHFISRNQHLSVGSIPISKCVV